MFKNSNLVPLYVYKINSGPVHKRLKLRFKVPGALRNYFAFCGQSLRFNNEIFIKYIDATGYVILSNGTDDKPFKLSFKPKRSS